MSRFAPREITLGRALGALGRRVHWLPSLLLWQTGLQGAGAKKARLRGLADGHHGQRCFVLANGPSLAKVDLDRLQGETVFGLNRIYLLSDKARLRLSYYVCINELVLRQFSEEIARTDCAKFLSWTERGSFREGSPHLHYVMPSLAIRDRFGTDITLPLSSGGSVTFVALQLACYMGFREVILLGLDHNYVSRGVPNATETRVEQVDRDHFDPAYFPPGTRWQLPDLRRSESAYRLARVAFEARGGRILDATIDGKCPVFERVALESVV